MYSQTLTAQISGGAQRLLLIHGWGMSSRVWRQCIPRLNKNFHITLVDLPGFGDSHAVESLDLAALLVELNNIMKGPYSVLGFSLGGMLAVQLAAQFPERVQRVISMAANAVFVQQPQWPYAMAKDIYLQFYQLAEQSPAIVLKKFLALQAKAADNEQDLLKQLRVYAAEEKYGEGALTRSLNLLLEIDNRLLIKTIKQPLLCIFGDCDQLVPVRAAEEIKNLGAQVHVIAGASHVPMLSHVDECCQLLEEFMLAGQGEHELARKLNKVKVAKSFSKAAQTYDDVAGLQRDVGEHLLSLLPDNSNAVERVVDLGCGTGYFLPKLQQQILSEQLLAFDLAEAMLSYARQHREVKEAVWLCADAESIPLADNSVDIIFSSLAIQWCEALDDLFNEIYRVLKPGGQFVFSTLGPDTLKELRQAWQQVDSYIHVNQFLPEHSLKSAISSAGFKTKQWQQQNIVLQYATLPQLTRELKALGAHNVNAGRPEGLTGKRRIKAFRSAYEAQRTEQNILPATYQVWCAVIEKSVSLKDIKHG